MTKRGSSGMASQERKIVDFLVDVFRSNPKAIERISPELARHLEEVVAGRPVESAPSRTRLTEKERADRLSAVHGIRRGQKFSDEEATKALESAAALLEDAYANGSLDREWLAQLAKRVSGLSYSLKGRPVEKTIRPGELSRSVSLIRGVTLGLTWDWRLISVSVDQRELWRRKRALAFVGIASDVSGDVAEKHDEYLREAISGS
ncbi:MAG TPA: hypothetical protein VJM51_03580 [Dehalococcoidia bacterium]|nr:hypothetical protein [Dehalococcoidia bacterium]